jgi:hypothetical protein
MMLEWLGRLEPNLEAREERVRLVIIMTAGSNVPVIKITVLQQQAHVLVQFTRHSR